MTTMPDKCPKCGLGLLGPPWDHTEAECAETRVARRLDRALIPYMRESETIDALLAAIRAIRDYIDEGDTAAVNEAIRRTTAFLVYFGWERCDDDA